MALLRMRSRRIRYNRRAFASLSRSVTACVSGGVVAALGIIYHTKSGVNDGSRRGVSGSSISVLRLDIRQFGVIRRNIEPHHDAGEAWARRGIELHHQRVMARHDMLRRRR